MGASVKRKPLSLARAGAGKGANPALGINRDHRTSRGQHQLCRRGMKHALRCARQQDPWLQANLSVRPANHSVDAPDVQPHVRESAEHEDLAERRFDRDDVELRQQRARTVLCLPEELAPHSPRSVPTSHPPRSRIAALSPSRSRALAGKFDGIRIRLSQAGIHHRRDHSTAGSMPCARQRSGR